MKRTGLFLWLLLLFPVISVGQINLQEDHQQDQQGIKINTDPRLDKMLERDIAYNKEKEGIDGYRIQIYFNSGPTARDEANQLKAQVLSDYPDVPVYIIFHSPFYKVRVGNYRSKLDALSTFYALKKKYPGAYIVKDVITLPSLTQE